MTLGEGIAALGLTLPPGAEEKLSAYLALLAKWNKVYNLTAIREPEAMVTHHLLDSLAVLPILQESALAGRHATLADVGSGAGLPGLVLAIARPDWRVASIEAVEKKAAFQRQAKIELGLSNVSIHCGRVEDWQERFDAVISRAFASLAEFVALAGHLADRLWAMKGAYPAEEIAALPAGWRVSACHGLHVPGLKAERCLLLLEREK
ncbi:MAG: 16S rRNA (guanine(527)-N(7))-methyltransferase RsmG [Pseudomonadota bacterium]|uniref:16S rRNA (guanine(527)-N(7))-methyltransferase RsmG n=1 Tax=Sulfuricystis thermophila TaxID=2496847 RepID=UPI001036303C|nr:16S rRNA (guanine(527)-N(7))-methyltransferase RsmG [Sulfuricystis thermophila]MDI6750330.1 16S rRNA (guanine(527)-N(7))-methyltransferase RsmG [Rhodocyclaceae bacterium]